MSTMKIFIFLSLLLLAGIAEYAIASTPWIRDETSSWKTYLNEKYGFEVRYPQGWEVLDNNPINSLKFDLSFRDVKYNSSFEWPGFRIKNFKSNESEMENRGVHATRSFSKESAVNELVAIYFDTDRQRIYATCALYLDQTVITKCNQILSTFKSIPSEDQFQVSNTESKESFEYTTPGGIPPSIFRSLQYLITITLLIIVAFIFKLRPNVFKVIFSAIFTIIPPMLFGSCFIVDAPLPQFCEYQILVALLTLPAFIFGELGDFISSATLRSMVMPIIVPFLSFIIWYIIGSVLFTIYNRMLKK